MEKFNALLTEILTQLDIDPNRALREYSKNCDLKIIYSDIYESKSIVASMDDAALDALRLSCSIPILFASFKNADGGKTVDGGAFNNMPVDFLLHDRNQNVPVFAIGFKAEAPSPANTSIEYISALASASINHRVIQSRQLIGENMVLDLETEIGTLDFYKIGSVGIDQEYRKHRGVTRDYLKSWLQGSGPFSDPISRNWDTPPSIQLRRNEIALMDHISEISEKAPCESKYLKMAVNAHSLSNPNVPDEIIVEQFIKLPENYIMPGVALPVTIGDGYRASLECFVCLDSPTGAQLEFTDFISNDESDPKDANDVNSTARRRPSAVMLFRDDLSKLAGRHIYLLKKEQRYGFMASLREKGNDYLALRSFYWRTDVVSLQLNIPKSFGGLDVVWMREGHNAAPDLQPKKVSGELVLVPTNYNCYMARVESMLPGDRLRGVFNRPGQCSS